MKCLTLVRRAADLAPAEFGARWREQTDKALARMPASTRPTRLAHCVVRRGCGDPAYDGVAISWYGEAALSAHDAWVAEHASTDAVLDRSATTCVRVQERTAIGAAWLDAQWRDPVATARLLLIGFIEPANGLTRQQFRDYWWDHHRPLADRLVPAELGPVAYVHNYVSTGEPGRWAGIGELYEQSLDVARRARRLVRQRCRGVARRRRGTLPRAQHPAAARHRPRDHRE